MQACAGGERGREVEHDAVPVRPEIEIAGNELAVLIDADRLQETDLGADLIQGRNDALTPIAEARIDHRRDPRSGDHDLQHPQPTPCSELVVGEVLSLGLVRPRGLSAVLTQLRLHASLQRLAAQLQAQLIVNPVNSPVVHIPVLPPKMRVHHTVALVHPRLADVIDALPDRRRIGATRLEVMRRPLYTHSILGSAHQDGPAAEQFVDQS